MKSVEEIALEVANAMEDSYGFHPVTKWNIQFATHFLAAVNQERGKDAVAWICGTYPFYSYLKAVQFSQQNILPITPLFLHPTIPAGFVLVPAEATDAMLEAWKTQLMIPVGSSPEAKARRAYKAMIQAAQEGETK